MNVRFLMVTLACTYRPALLTLIAIKARGTLSSLVLQPPSPNAEPILPYIIPFTISAVPRFGRHTFFQIPHSFFVLSFYEL